MLHAEGGVAAPILILIYILGQIDLSVRGNKMQKYVKIIRNIVSRLDLI